MTKPKRGVCPSCLRLITLTKGGTLRHHAGAPGTDPDRLYGQRRAYRCAGAGQPPKLGKLVRDRIPQIIREDGAEPVTYTASPAEYRTRLRYKLPEEVGEFLAADDTDAPEELADVLEVVYALAADLGIDPDQLEKIRKAKVDERGGFASRIVWTGNRRP